MSGTYAVAMVSSIATNHSQWFRTQLFSNGNKTPHVVAFKIIYIETAEVTKDTTS